VIGGGEIPYRWELGFTHLPKTDQRHVLVGQNFSPAIVQDAMLNSVLPWTPLFLDADEPIGLFVHRITPARQTLDYGKTELDVGGDERAAVRVALEKIAAPWIKRRNAELRGKKPPPERKPERVTFQDAAFSTMAAAYDAASSDSASPPSKPSTAPTPPLPTNGTLTPTPSTRSPSHDHQSPHRRRLSAPPRRLHHQDRRYLARPGYAHPNLARLPQAHHRRRPEAPGLSPAPRRYCLTGDTREHALFFFYGTGANGKSVLINTWLGIWKDYTITIGSELLMTSPTERHPTEIARLRGVRLAVASEIEIGRTWAEAKIKVLTGASGC
jgi:hypothetical protein